MIPLPNQCGFCICRNSHQQADNQPEREIKNWERFNNFLSTARSILVPAVAMINIEQGRRWKHYQLTTTNNQFTLDESLMEKVFEACGYHFTVITPSPSVLVFTGNKPEPYFIVKEVAKALGYKKAENLTRHFYDKGLDLLKLTKDNGLDELKSFINNCELPVKNTDSLIHEFTPSLLLIPGSSLQEYCLRYAKTHKAKVIAD